MSTTLSRTSFVLIEGDSIADPALAFQIFNGTRRYIYGHYNSGSAGVFKAPLFRNQATSGATTATVAARVAAELAVNAYTHLFINLGINDAQTGVALATSQANCTTILNAATAAGVAVVWIGPMCWGEKWPSGQNGAVDTNIDGGVPGVYAALDGALKTLVEGAGFTYIHVRQTVYAFQEPLLNTASPGLAVGPLTGPDASGAHGNPSGMSFVTQQVTPTLTLS